MEPIEYPRLPSKAPLLSLIALLALTGFSRSDYRDLDGFSYAVGLYRKLEELKQLDKSVQYVAFVERCHKAIEF